MSRTQVDRAIRWMKIDGNGARRTYRKSQMNLMCRNVRRCVNNFNLFPIPVLDVDVLVDAVEIECNARTSRRNKWTRRQENSARCHRPNKPDQWQPHQFSLLVFVEFLIVIRWRCVKMNELNWMRWGAWSVSFKENIIFIHTSYALDLDFG